MGGALEGRLIDVSLHPGIDHVRDTEVFGLAHKKTQCFHHAGVVAADGPAALRPMADRTQNWLARRPARRYRALSPVNLEVKWTTPTRSKTRTLLYPDGIRENRNWQYLGPGQTTKRKMADLS
jgi:hypothetical protein